MKVENVQQLYDHSYARDYDEKFRQDGYFQHVSETETEIIRHLLGHDSRWLDVGCGTGYMLSRFPGVLRAGMDISTAMLEHAQAANPDALFFRQADFRERMPQWEDQWTLVTCMWYAYCYVESMAEIKALIKNLADWTSPDGACFVPISEVEDLSPGVTLPYCTEQRAEAPVHGFGGPWHITGITWSWTDLASGGLHENLVAPHPEYMASIFREHFEVVEFIQYPPYKPGWRPLRAIVATGKSGGRSVETTEAIRAIRTRMRAFHEEGRTSSVHEAAPHPETQAEHANGWLRQVWRRLPPEARRLVKAAFGES